MLQDFDCRFEPDEPVPGMDNYPKPSYTWPTGTKQWGTVKMPDGGNYFLLGTPLGEEQIQA